MSDVLISIKPNFVDDIISGLKTVELRRRNVSFGKGTKIWIYSTLPSACIKAVATVKAVESLSLDVAWKNYEKEIKITPEEFKSYTYGKDTVTVIILNDIKLLSEPVSLSVLREYVGKFHPPQFYSYLKEGSLVLELLTKAPLKSTQKFSTAA